MVRKREILVLGMFVFAFLISLSFVSAELFNIDSAVPNYINRTINTLLNFTINNTGTLNITQVIIQLPQGQGTYYATSNGTDASTSVFSNTSNQLIWTNTTAGGFIANASSPATQRVKSFWFNASFSQAGSQVFIIATNDTSKIGNQTTQTLIVNFAFSAYVKNETGGIIENATAEFYEFLTQPNAPPIENLVKAMNSSSSGLFNFASINGSVNLYKIKIYFKNQTGGGNITKTSSVLPPFPSSIFYGMCPMGEGMCPFSPSLNGTTFYLQPAATLSIFAINTSGANHLFGYEVMDQLTGMSIASGIMGNVSNVNVTVPTGRTYTVMVLRDPSKFSFADECDGTFFNNTHCPAPPKSNSTINPSVTGQVINVNLNLTIVNRYMYGCIEVTGNSTPITNITSIYPKLLPWTGFVPPIKAETGDINISDSAQLNYSDSRCSGKMAWYNVSLMNAVYLMEFYGRNSTTGSGSEYVGGIYNVSLESSNLNQNITLRPLFGSYPTGIGLDDLNVTKMKMNLQNSSGGVASNLHNVEFIVKNPVFGTLHYIISSNKISNGTFFMPIINNTNWAKVTVFGNGPPVDRFLNLSATENNITIPSGELGFRKVLANGTLISTNLSEMPIQMSFLFNSVLCSSLSEFRNPSSSCIITNMTASDFNPLKVMAAGKVNMIMKITSTNVSVVYHNFDLFAAKPPTNTLINENASSYGTQEQTWKFGSFAPSHVYNNVTILIPYSGDSSATNYLNESWTFGMKIPLLYTQNLQNPEQLDVVWNSSRDTSANLTDEFIAYNASYYRGYLTSSGITCTSTSTDACYIDTSNNIVYMRLPHFSGLSPTVSGNAPAVTTTTTTVSPSGGGVVIEKKGHTWTKIIPGETKEMTGLEKFGIEKIQVSVKEEAQNVKITVSKYDSKPAEVTIEKTGKVYSYLKIDTENLDDKLEKAVIALKLNKTWFSENNLEKEDIALFKFDETAQEWNELTTTFTEEDDTYYYYEAEVTSFSYFAIGEKAVEEAPEEEITPEEEVIKAIKKNYLWIVIGIVILAAIIGLIIAKKKKQQ